jgi:hypothetical protein
MYLRLLISYLIVINSEFGKETKLQPNLTHRTYTSLCARVAGSIEDFATHGL